MAFSDLSRGKSEFSKVGKLSNDPPQNAGIAFVSLASTSQKELLLLALTACSFFRLKGSEEGKEIWLSTDESFSSRSFDTSGALASLLLANATSFLWLDQCKFCLDFVNGTAGKCWAFFGSTILGFLSDCFLRSEGTLINFSFSSLPVCFSIFNSICKKTTNQQKITSERSWHNWKWFSCKNQL